ncbi:MAG: hypothetical protein FWE33_05690 [Defluviitaleaceae bacterium]|nr:hypothetical protein [Defluviitaleaceae bacterium]
MAYETKVILTLLAEYIGRAATVEEAYECVVKAANVEGLKLPSYAEFQKQIKKTKCNCS